MLLNLTMLFVFFFEEAALAVYEVYYPLISHKICEVLMVQI